MLLDSIPINVFDKTINQMTKLQMDAREKFLAQEEMKRNHGDFPSKEYFRLRNAYERAETKKL